MGEREEPHRRARSLRRRRHRLSPRRLHLPGHARRPGAHARGPDDAGGGGGGAVRRRPDVHRPHPVRRRRRHGGVDRRHRPRARRAP